MGKGMGLLDLPGLPGLPFSSSNSEGFPLSSIVFTCFPMFCASEKRHGSIVLRFSTSVGASSVEEDRLASQAAKHGNTKKKARSEIMTRFMTIEDN